MTFQPLIPTVLTPAVVSVLPDTAVVQVASLLLGGGVTTARRACYACNMCNRLAHEIRMASHSHTRQRRSRVHDACQTRGISLVRCFRGDSDATPLCALGPWQKYGGPHRTQKHLA